MAPSTVVRTFALLEVHSSRWSARSASTHGDRLASFVTVDLGERRDVAGEIDTRQHRVLVPFTGIERSAYQVPLNCT